MNILRGHLIIALPHFILTVVAMRKIYTMNTFGLLPKKLTPIPVVGRGTWSPDGCFFAFTSTQQILEVYIH